MRVVHWPRAEVSWNGLQLGEGVFTLRGLDAEAVIDGNTFDFRAERLDYIAGAPNLRIIDAEDAKWVVIRQHEHIVGRGCCG